MARVVCVHASASLGGKSRWSCGWLVKVGVTDGDVGVSI